MHCQYFGTSDCSILDLLCNFYVHFTKIAPIMPAFCSLLLPTHYAKNFAGKIDGSLLLGGLFVAELSTG